MNPACLRIRKNILSISRASGHGHIPTCFSIVEILQAAYGTMRHDPRDPAMEGRDLLLLSKGHGALAHYCVLAEQGYFPVERVNTFGGFLSDFGCHADLNLSTFSRMKPILSGSLTMLPGPMSSRWHHAGSCLPLPMPPE